MSYKLYLLDKAPSGGEYSLDDSSLCEIKNDILPDIGKVFPVREQFYKVVSVMPASELPAKARGNPVSAVVACKLSSLESLSTR